MKFSLGFNNLSPSDMEIPKQFEVRSLITGMHIRACQTNSDRAFESPIGGLFNVLGIDFLNSLKHSLVFKVFIKILYVAELKRMKLFNRKI